MRIHLPQKVFLSFFVGVILYLPLSVFLRLQIFLIFFMPKRFRSASRQSTHQSLLTSLETSRCAIAAIGIDEEQIEKEERGEEEEEETSLHLPCSLSDYPLPCRSSSKRNYISLLPTKNQDQYDTKITEGEEKQHEEIIPVASERKERRDLSGWMNRAHGDVTEVAPEENSSLEPAGRDDEEEGVPPTRVARMFLPPRGGGIATSDESILDSLGVDPSLKESILSMDPESRRETISDIVRHHQQTQIAPEDIHSLLFGMLSHGFNVNSGYPRQRQQEGGGRGRGAAQDGPPQDALATTTQEGDEGGGDHSNIEVVDEGVGEMGGMRGLPELNGALQFLGSLDAQDEEEEEDNDEGDEPSLHDNNTNNHHHNRDENAEIEEVPDRSGVPSREGIPAGGSTGSGRGFAGLERLLMENSIEGRGGGSLRLVYMSMMLRDLLLNHQNFLRQQETLEELGIDRDIDDLSYEELLELEERIGKVSKGLPEEKAKSVLLPVPNVTAKDGSCSICLDQLLCETTKDGPMKVAKLQTCQHLFHEQCILGWLKESKKCPVCGEEVSITN